MQLSFFDYPMPRQDMYARLFNRPHQTSFLSILFFGGLPHQLSVNNGRSGFRHPVDT